MDVVEFFVARGNALVQEGLECRAGNFIDRRLLEDAFLIYVCATLE